MNKLFKTIQYGSIIFGALTTFYYALPIEYQEMIPQVNNLTVAITALGGGALGTVMSLFSKKFNKLTAETEQKINLLAKGFVNVVENIQELKKDVKETLNVDIKEKQDQNVIINNLGLELKETKQQLIDFANLVKVDLQVKANNALVDLQAKKLIEEVLNGKQEEQTATTHTND